MSRWPRRTPKERFWAKVQRRGADDCWLWIAAANPWGYGVFGFGPNRHTLAHRFAWELINGPAGEGCILHSCDTPGCCNPRHLFLGTRTDNHADMVGKGRQARGLMLPQTKLKPSDRPVVRSLYATGRWLQRELAEKFGVSRPTISRTVNHA